MEEASSFKLPPSTSPPSKQMCFFPLRSASSCDSTLLEKASLSIPYCAPRRSLTSAPRASTEMNAASSAGEPSGAESSLATACECCSLSAERVARGLSEATASGLAAAYSAGSTQETVPKPPTK